MHAFLYFRSDLRLSTTVSRIFRLLLRVDMFPGSHGNGAVVVLPGSFPGLDVNLSSVVASGVYVRIRKTDTRMGLDAITEAI